MSEPADNNIVPDLGLSTPEERTKNMNAENAGNAPIKDAESFIAAIKALPPVSEEQSISAGFELAKFKVETDSVFKSLNVKQQEAVSVLIVMAGSLIPETGIAKSDPQVEEEVADIIDRLRKQVPDKAEAIVNRVWEIIEGSVKAALRPGPEISDAGKIEPRGHRRLTGRGD